MAGQGIVIVEASQWSVWLATTPTEMTQGLSSMESIPPGSGMLFDLGVDYQQIQINMLSMLFPLDIIFINSSKGVVGVLHNVQPGETDVRFEAVNIPGARYFLEVNALEASNIEYGNTVNISGNVQPQFWNVLLPILLATLVVVPIVAVAGKGILFKKEE